MILLKIFILLFMGCTKQVLTSEDPSPIFETMYFNNELDGLYFYAEINNHPNLDIVDSVWVEIFNSNDNDIHVYRSKLSLQSLHSNYGIYSHMLMMDELDVELSTDMYFSKFYYRDKNNNVNDKTELKPLISVVPSILSVDMADKHILDATEWTEFYIRLEIMDLNGQSDIEKVEYEVKRNFAGCSFDQNNDGSIDGAIIDDDYTNLGFSDWEIKFDVIEYNNILEDSSFFYKDTLLIRPVDGSEYVGEDVEFEASDCGKTGSMLFRFIVTDKAGLQDIEDDIQLEIIAP